LKSLSNTSHQLVFWLILIAVAAAGLSSLVQDGMFMDGLMYAVVSRNLANDIGTYWLPRFTDTIIPEFQGHPPFVFWLQSLFFGAVGDHWWTERLYTLLTAFATAFFIHKIWKALEAETEVVSSWLPILLWLLTPIVFYSYGNNLLENTMGIFTTAALYWLIKAHKTEKIVLYYVLSTVCILFAVWCKGPVALFPLSAPLFYVLTTEGFAKKNKAIRNAILISGLFGIFCAILWAIPVVRATIQNYLQLQVVQSLEGKIGTNRHRFFIIGSLFQDLLPILSVVAFVWLFYRHRLSPQNARLSLFFLLMGLAASLPIAISPKQSAFYYLGACPMFALSGGFAISEIIAKWLRGASSHVYTYFYALTAVLWGGAALFIYPKIGTACKDANKLHDLSLVAPYFQPRDTLQASPDLCLDYDLMGYAYRYYYLNFIFEESPNSRYILTQLDTENPPCETCTELPLLLKEHRLWKK
jgi:4-amino-4-deoxy-L-arabinose transferase-like glycosyltransferase